MKPQHCILLFILFFPLFSYSQISVSPYVSLGYMNHLRRDGINTNLGIDLGIFKRINITPELRYSSLKSDAKNEIEIQALSLFLSYVIINKAHHKLMVGTGYSYANYKRFGENFGFEKEYNDNWFNPLKIRYDYIFDSQIKVGIDASFYGDDGDGSTYLGLVLGYNLR